MIHCHLERIVETSTCGDSVVNSGKATVGTKLQKDFKAISRECEWDVLAFEGLLSDGTDLRGESNPPFEINGIRFEIHGNLQLIPNLIAGLIWFRDDSVEWSRWFKERMIVTCVGCLGNSSDKC